MTDTATALVDLAGSDRRGVVHLDSNAEDGWSFADVVRHVARISGREWVVEEHDEFRRDSRLVGDEDLMPRFSQAS